MVNGLHAVSIRQAGKQRKISACPCQHKKYLQPYNWPEECGVRYAEAEELELYTLFKLES